MSRNLTLSTSLKSIREKEMSTLKGYMYFLALVVTGIGIMFYVFVVNPGEDSIDNQTFIDNDIPPSENTNYNSSKIHRKRSNWIKYNGVMETNANIQFILDGYDRTAQYLFDFGDGITKKCRSKKISHAYVKPGKYTVIVRVRYDNKVTEAWKETLTIKNGIIVDPAAFM